MPTDGKRLLAAYRAVDATLAKLPGGYPTSPAWMSALTEFWLSGKRRMVVRKGRQGGGSTTLARVAVATALGGEHSIPPGTRGEIGFVSIKLREANERLYNIESILRALDVPHRRSDDTIELTDRPIIFRSSPCTSRERGQTRVTLVEDELASWRNEESGRNPAKDVDAAAVPSLITQANARIYSLSSPIGHDDFHAELMARGTTDAQAVFSGPSWAWNPAITEQATRDLQPDERVWRREFAAIPQGSSLGAFDPDAIEQAFRDLPDCYITGAPIVAIDPAGRGSDTFAALTAGWHLPRVDEEDRWMRDDILLPDGTLFAKGGQIRQDADGHYILNEAWQPAEPLLCFWNYETFEAKYRSVHTADEICARLGAIGRTVGAVRCVSDSFDAFSLESLLAQNGLRLMPFPWTATLKTQAVARLRRLLNEGRIWFADHDLMKRELLAYEERVTANGISYGGTAPGGGHFDLLSCVLTTAMAEISGALIGAPERKGAGRMRDVTHEFNSSTF